MKRFFIKILLFFSLIIVVDVVLGHVFDYMLAHTKGGINGRNNYICNETNEEILVFGSSRAQHSYNPKIISDSSGLSCYNCAQNANGIILAVARYQLILQRYKPKVLIYDVTPTFDFLGGEDNSKYLGWLRAYYDRNGIPAVFESIDKTEKVKMVCQMYRHNTKFLALISDYIHPLTGMGNKGFRPYYEKMDTMKLRNRIVDTDTPIIYDSIKISYLKKLVEESDYTKVVFVVSPWWYGADTILYQPVRELCNEYGIPYIDFSNHPKYVHCNDLFKDGSHLNSKGADEFSRDLCIELKKRRILQ